MKYGRFLAMIATSTVVMFVLMYLNTYLVSHVFWSETRAYMALVMGGAMAVVMLTFMLSMYRNTAANAAIFIGAAVLFGVALWLVRSQVTVGDTSFMRAMIPHHSIAIMTSSRARISDPRVRKLADEIVYAQDKEIAEMRYLIADIEESGDKATAGSDAPASVVSLDQALSSAEIAILDAEFMTADEIGQVFPDGASCTFTYTQDSPPVLAVGEADGGLTGLVKISGDLVRLPADGAGTTFGAEGLTMRVSGPGDEPLTRDGAERAEADLVLVLDRGLTAGYRGYYGCGG